MTELSSAASDTVHVRDTPTRLALVAAAVSLPASAIGAATFFASNGGLGSKDALAAIFWSTPLALLIFVSFKLALARLHPESPVRHYNRLAPLSAALGIAWTGVVALLLRGFLQGGGPILYGWVVAGLSAWIYAAERPERRAWTASVLVATVFGAALIGLGAFTNRP